MAGQPETPEPGEPEPKDRGDSLADAAAAVAIIVALCAAAVFWLSGR